MNVDPSIPPSSTQVMNPAAGPEAEAWFVAHGLPWFVPERREAAHRALHSSRTLVGLGVIVLIGLVAGVALAWVADEASLAPATLITLVGVAALGYAATELGAWPMARWALRRTTGSLRMLFPMITRALPLLLVFMTFLFINAEVWQVSATLDGGVLWVTVLLFAGCAVGFLLARLPEEVAHDTRGLEGERLVTLARRTPLEGYAHTIAERGQQVQVTEMHRMEKANLTVVLLVVQAVQVLLLAISVFAFFVVFGAIVMTHGVQEAWVGEGIHALPWATNLSVELLQVSAFLAAFAGLYFTVYAVTDETYRDQFFTQIQSELDRAIGVRTVYLAARADGPLR